MIFLKSIKNAAQDPISCITHLYGALVSLLTVVLFIIIALVKNSTMLSLVSSIVFALSAVGLYSASAYYHYIKRTSEHYTLFRKLDHSMIYVLIAGSYTPIVLKFLNPAEGNLFTIVMWLIALFGILTKIFWLNAPRILYTLLYIVMGWSIVFYFPALAKIDVNCLILLASGGISYTIGGILYIIKKPNLSEQFGFHELFHCFILGGTLLHFIAVGIFVL